MALRRVIKVKRYKIFRGTLFMGYGADLQLECGHTEYRKGSAVFKKAQCKECDDIQINEIIKRNGR